MFLLLISVRNHDSPSFFCAADLITKKFQKAGSWFFPVIKYTGDFRNYKAHGPGTENIYDTQGNQKVWEGEYEKRKRVYDDF